MMLVSPANLLAGFLLVSLASFMAGDIVGYCTAAMLHTRHHCRHCHPKGRQ